jgi:hypothetical protein
MHNLIAYQNLLSEVEQLNVMLLSYVTSLSNSCVAVVVINCPSL